MHMDEPTDSRHSDEPPPPLQRKKKQNTTTPKGIPIMVSPVIMAVCCLVESFLAVIPALLANARSTYGTVVGPRPYDNYYPKHWL